MKKFIHVFKPIFILNKMDEKEILVAMKRIKKIEDEARKRLIQTSLDFDKKISPKTKMGGKITKSNSTKSNYEKPVLKLYCIFIKPNGVQCSKYQIEGCNKMCKQHHDNSLKSKDPKDLKEPKVPKKVFISKDLEDPLPPIPSNKKVQSSEKPKKKESIPAAIKTLVWNKWVGEKEAEAGCYACRVTTISMRHFIAGHIVSEKHGGKCTIDNLRPICQPCNLSMGTMNMNEYIEKFGLHK
jgi:5-methylcytosine-specific restriction endonuclease McrA